MGFIGEVIAKTINFLNLDIVIFTSDLLAIGDYLLKSDKGIVKRQALSYNNKNTRKVLAEVGEEAAAIGMLRCK